MITTPLISAASGFGVRVVVREYASVNTSRDVRQVDAPSGWVHGANLGANDFSGMRLCLQGEQGCCP